MGKGVLETVFQLADIWRIQFGHRVTFFTQLFGVGFDLVFVTFFFELVVFLFAEALDQRFTLDCFLHFDSCVVEIAEHDVIERQTGRQRHLLIILSIVAAHPVADQIAANIAKQFGRVSPVFVFPGPHHFIGF